MNLDKDPESWARVMPDVVLAGSRAQQINVLKMALNDIAKLAAELEIMRGTMRYIAVQARKAHPGALVVILANADAALAGAHEKTRAMLAASRD